MMKQIPVRYNKYIQKYIKVRSKEFVFVPKHNISLAFIDEDVLDAVLSIREGCCGQVNKIAFRIATDVEVEIWQGLRER